MYHGLKDDTDAFCYLMQAHSYQTVSVSSFNP